MLAQDGGPGEFSDQSPNSCKLTFPHLQKGSSSSPPPAELPRVRCFSNTNSPDARFSVAATEAQEG